jgi:hypothetical protein
MEKRKPHFDLVAVKLIVPQRSADAFTVPLCWVVRFLYVRITKFEQ